MNNEIGILFCSRNEEIPEQAIEHLNRNNKELYWSTIGFSIRKENLILPIVGLIHVKGKNVMYRCNIVDIKPYDITHHTDPTKKPQEWIDEQRNNPENDYRSTLVIAAMEKFNYNTRDLVGIDGRAVINPPRGYQRVILPQD
jgi:hypothetical protein